MLVYEIDGCIHWGKEQRVWICVNVYSYFFFYYIIIGQRYQRVPIDFIDLCVGWYTVSEGCSKEEIKLTVLNV